MLIGIRIKRARFPHKKYLTSPPSKLSYETKTCSSSANSRKSTVVLSRQHACLLRPFPLDRSRSSVAGRNPEARFTVESRADRKQSIGCCGGRDHQHGSDRLGRVDVRILPVRFTRREGRYFPRWYVFTEQRLRFSYMDNL